MELSALTAMGCSNGSESIALAWGGGKAVVRSSNVGFNQPTLLFSQRIKVKTPKAAQVE